MKLFLPEQGGNAEHRLCIQYNIKVKCSTIVFNVEIQSNVPFTKFV